MLKRTHMCGALRRETVGQLVVVSGWVRRHRDHGRVVFLDLWDRTGVVQVVADPAISDAALETAQSVRDEYVVAVQGTVRARPAGTENPALATGAIEVAASQIEVLNAVSPLPFPMEDAAAVDETLRLRYRYLDLRRTAMLGNLELRHRVLKSLRHALDNAGFLEVETPLLTRSTPEGARDYLVPSRVHPGQFYALPQSPQQMKQLLMVAGLDRYYQIARCFRDEDLRADRQPEFTQLDLEMSFVEPEDILSLVEDLISGVAQAARPDCRVATPFPRLTYDQAMSRYGTDKPDLRWDMRFLDCTELLGSTDVRIFRQIAAAGGAIKGFCVSGYADATEAELETLQVLSRQLGAEGVIWFHVEDGDLRAPIARHIAAEEQHSLIQAFRAREGDILFLVAGEVGVVHTALDGLRREIGRRLGLDDPATLAFAWVVDFPLFKWNDETRRWDAEHHPFTRPKASDQDLLESEPAAVRAECYDLVCNGWELGSGSIRIHERALQSRVFSVLGLSPPAVEENFGHLMEALGYGAPPHGGIALGIDRLVAILAGTDSIRDVIAFPKTRQASDLTMRAPAPVEAAQLGEIHVRVAKPKRHPTPAARRQG